MKKYIIPGAIILIFAIYTMMGNTGEGDFDSEKLSTLLEEGSTLLIDVRTQGEFNAGHIPGAILIPYDTLPQAMVEWPKEGSIVVYCRSGNRSSQAKIRLEGAGYTSVLDFGAFSSWKGSVEY